MTEAKTRPADKHVKLASYLISASGIALAPTANATIVHVDYSPDLTARDTAPTAYGINERIHINLDPTNLATFGNAFVSTSGLGDPYELLMIPEDTYTNTGGKDGPESQVYAAARTWAGSAGVQSAGSPFGTVDASLPFSNSTDYLYYKSDVSNVYLGLQIALPSAGDYLYGWLKYSGTVGNALTNTSSTITLHELAVEMDPNTAIRNGQLVSDPPAPVSEPVPAPASLALLAIGAAGLGAARRRKQQAA